MIDSTPNGNISMTHKEGTLISIAKRAKSRASMETIQQARVTKTAGIEGDFRGKPGKRQVTLLSLKAWQEACNAISAQDLPWTTRRANLLIEGIAFGPNDVGAQVQIGELVLEVTRETDPCSRMDKQHLGLTEALLPNWRGGVCCRVIADGTIATGDKVMIKKIEQSELNL